MGYSIKISIAIIKIMVDRERRMTTICRGRRRYVGDVEAIVCGESEW